jgi:hypothetical protein
MRSLVLLGNNWNARDASLQTSFLIYRRRFWYFYFLEKEPSNFIIEMKKSIFRVLAIITHNFLLS